MTQETGIQIPLGFLFSVAEAAIKKPGRKDIALIVSEVDANIAGMFTKNTVRAAPVRICIRKVRSGKGKAIIANSGNANACTGKQGMRDAEEIVSIVSHRIGVDPSLTYMCSTGVIGAPLPMGRIAPALATLVDNIGRASFADVSKAIMTTDTFSKMVSRTVKMGRKSGTITGICKGAGMIAPNMATMLCFILTDIAVEKKTLSAVLKESVDKSFNRITIDGETSTNDTVLIMANGKLGNTPLARNSRYSGPFRNALDEVTYELSKLVVKDGEGATKLIEVVVKGAKSGSQALKAAFAIANSSLVKTAIYGSDANWGRIMCAVGYSGIQFREEKADIFFNSIQVVKRGLATHQDEEATFALREKEVTITVDLNEGKASAKVLTCDFTEEYIRINAEYRT